MKKSREKKERMKKTIGLVAIIVALIAISTFVYFFSDYNTDPPEQPTAAPVEIVAAIPSPSPIPIASDLIEEQEAEEILSHVLPYYQSNEDTVGYIKIENTDVDYPVVYSGDNEFYMTRGFDKEDAEHGAIFLDFRCDLDDFNKTRNIILYGHRMKDGSMFKSLTSYQKSKFFEENRIIEFDTLYDDLEWEVFAVFLTHIDFYYIDTDFPTDEKWLNFLSECQSLSMHENNVKFYPTDIILTLSTCALKTDKRFVVMAKLKH